MIHRLVHGSRYLDTTWRLATKASPARKFRTIRAAQLYQPANGGHGDGRIDKQDAIFSKLLVWVDKNHNGISDPGELLTMAQAGIQAISLSYSPANWTDAFGNTFRYSSQMQTNASTHQVIHDVLLHQAQTGGTK